MRGWDCPTFDEASAAAGRLLEGRACATRIDQTLARLSSPGNGWPMPETAVATIWKNGRDTFLFKGNSGRWCGVQTASEPEIYERAKALPAARLRCLGIAWLKRCAILATDMAAGPSR